MSGHDGHLALCEELLGLFNRQRKALVEGRLDEAASLMQERASVIERLKPLMATPPPEAERERLKSVVMQLAAEDAALQTIVGMRMSDLSGRMGALGTSRRFADSLSTGGEAKAVSRLNLKG